MNEVIVRVAQLFAYMEEINMNFTDDQVNQQFKEKHRLCNDAFLTHLHRFVDLVNCVWMTSLLEILSESRLKSIKLKDVE